MSRVQLALNVADIDTVIREEVHRLSGRLLADLPAEIQSHFVSVCLQRLSQDLLGGRDTRSWRPIAYVLAANYSLIKSRELRRQLIDKYREGPAILVYFEPTTQALMNQGKMREAFQASHDFIARPP